MFGENCNIERKFNGGGSEFVIGNFPLKHLMNQFNVACMNEEKPPIIFFDERTDENGTLYVSSETAPEREKRIDNKDNEDNNSTTESENETP